MGYRRNEEEFTFEAKVEFGTAKAMLIEMTLGGKYWLPKSQIIAQTAPDIDGNIEFIVSGWWWGVKTEVE